MHVIAIASQKSGAGKSTFAANLAVLADRADAPSLLIDADPQGSLTRWHQTRGRRTPLLAPCLTSELDEVLETARRQKSIEWVFVDGPAQQDDVAAAIRVATVALIPTRPAVFDLASVPATIAIARRVRRPFFVALNGVPPRYGALESPIVAAARRAIRDMGAPVWRGAVAQRIAYARAFQAGQAVTEFETAGPAADEMLQLWRDVGDAARAMAVHHRPG